MNKAGLQLPLALDPPRRQMFDNFVAGGNRSVTELLRAGLEQGGWYLIAGPAGYGKSHLTAALFNAHAGRTACVFLPLSRLSAGQRDALFQSTGVGLTVMDDIDSIAGDRVAEEALFHALNRWREHGVTVVMTAAGLDDFTLPDLRSRLGLATRLTLQGLDDRDRRQLIGRVAADLGLELDDHVIEYLLTRGPRNPGRLSQQLKDLWELARSERRGVTLPLVRKSLVQ